MVQRNTIPNSIYVLFKKNIMEKRMPSASELTRATIHSPSMEKYTINDLRKFVSRAMALNSAVNDSFKKECV